MRKIGKERIFWINKIIEMSFLKDLWGFIRERRKWWLLPLIVTIGSFIIASWYEAPRGGYINLDFEGLFRYTAGLIVSLVAWLVYDLVT